jgi:hypothetical protein
MRSDLVALDEAHNRLAQERPIKADLVSFVTSPAPSVE